MEEAGSSCHQVEQPAHAETEKVTDRLAEDAHQNADTGIVGIVGDGDDRRGGRTADVGDRRCGDHAQIPMEQLGENVHTDNMENEDEHTVDDPHRSLDQSVQRRLRGKQSNNGIEKNAGKLIRGGQLAERSHGAGETEDRDEQSRASTLIKHLESHTGETSAHLRADPLRERGNNESKADHPDPVARGRLSLLLLFDLFVGDIGDRGELGGVRLNGLVPLGGVADHEDQKGDPHRVADGIKRERAGIRAGVDGKRVLHGGHVGRAADPGGVQSGRCAPDGLTAAEAALENGEADDEADRERDGAAEEDGDHAAGELGELAEVAAQQHDEDHCIQQIVLQTVVGRRDRVGIEQAHRAEHHVEQIDPNERGHIVEDLPLGVFFERQQAAGYKHQKRDEGKAVLNSR